MDETRAELEGGIGFLRCWKAGYRVAREKEGHDFGFRGLWWIMKSRRTKAESAAACRYQLGLVTLVLVSRAALIPNT